METNLVRRLNWLWKNRHTHDDDSESADTRQLIIEVIGEERPPADVPTGARIHLQRAANQSIPSATATAISWDSLGTFTPRNFATPSLPSSSVTVQETGYYDLHVALLLASAVSSPSVHITLTRSGSEQTVWPMSSDPGIWTADYSTDRFSGTAKAIPCLSGDIIKVYVTQSSGSAVNVTDAVLAVELVDRVDSQASTAQVTSAAYTNSGPTTSHDVTLPSAVSGDLLIVGVSTLSPTTITFPAGWTTLGTEDTGSLRLSSKWAYRQADGTEGSSVNVTLSTSTWAFGHSVVVSGAWSAVEAATSSQSITDSGTPVTSAQPPTVTVSSGGSYVVFVSALFRDLWDLSGPSGWQELEVFNFIGGGHPELAALLSKSESPIGTSLTPGAVSIGDDDANGRATTFATIAVKLEE